MAAADHRDYSGTPLPKKLGIHEGSRVLVLFAPQGFSLGTLPSGVEVLERVRRPLDVALVFATRRSVLARRFPAVVRALAPAGRLWVAWPKKTANVETDLTFGAVQRLGIDAGLVDNKSASIDDVFQGLQLVVRLVDRASR